MRSSQLVRIGLLVVSSSSSLVVSQEEKESSLHHLRTATRRNQEEDGTVDLEQESNTVVGGTTASDGEFPFFALFGDTNCGGTMISDNRVLTAAHCVASGAPRSVRVGASTTSNGVEVGVSCSKTHPDWNSETPFINDVAVLKLFGSTTVSPFATLNTNTATPAGGADVLLVGFGQTTAGSSTGTGSDTLQKLTYSAISDTDCATAWGSRVSASSNICAQNTATTGACFGDSGGPLMATDKTTQLGLISGGSSNCASGGVPDVYTEVANFNGWITEQLTDSSCDACPYSQGCLEVVRRWMAQAAHRFSW
ncbi:Chymotrypsin-like elastase family member 1 [Seminavis robusta]|uniref:Chymotrypsin-like elastase family member 1 n=1 Tax=Seminavis robusta TaxID=568900 RepID=A0A9N8ECT6_9STRA|nr:Chymotrypsin-like elastase family member 1 [Seminavis robusta]|eukprot:Sro765_g199150.1 Chymotrypsin-like elastase family member 1 (309) ;mRNA; r:10752-12160